MNWPSQQRQLRGERQPRLRCTLECIVCVVALVRSEVCEGTLARRTPPNWDGALGSTLGTKSFTTRQILSLSRDQSGKPGKPGRRNIGRGSCRSARADGK